MVLVTQRDPGETIKDFVRDDNADTIGTSAIVVVICVSTKRIVSIPRHNEVESVELPDDQNDPNYDKWNNRFHVLPQFTSLVNYNNFVGNVLNRELTLVLGYFLLLFLRNMHIRLVGDLILFPFPEFEEDGGPNSQKYDVNRHVFRIFVLRDHDINTNYNAWD